MPRRKNDDPLKNIFASERAGGEISFDDSTENKGTYAVKFAKATGKVALFGVKHLFAICVGLGVAHNASDGQSTKAVMDNAEAVFGKERIVQAAQKLFEGAKYIGNGWVGISKEADTRYGVSSALLPVVPPPGKLGLTLTSVATAGEEELSRAIIDEHKKQQKAPPGPLP